jgi:hypothetical protein
MKNLCLFALVSLLFIVLPLPVLAQDEAKYNFASAQGDKELKIPPGKEGRGYLYFYNVDGNRITHITLEVSQSPANWKVSIEPPLSETQVLVSGMPVTVEENLYVEPAELLPEEPQNVPEDMVSIKVPGRGYALGKLARVKIVVPDSTPLGTTGEITVSAEAAWLGQSGSAAVKQARDFNFSVAVVSSSKEYTETIIKPDDTIQTTGENTRAGENTEKLPPSPNKSSGFSLMGWPIAVIGGAIVILVVIFIVMLIRRRG